MGSKGRHFTDGTIQDRKRTAGDRGRAYQYEPCNANYPVMGPNSWSLPTGGDGNFGRCCFPGGDVTYRMTGIQTNLGPAIDGTSGKLWVGGDKTVAKGVQYIFTSVNQTDQRHVHTVGTGGVFARLNFEIETVAGSAEILFGYRKNETWQADWNNYDELAALRVNAGDIYVSTILNGAATTNTDTTSNWADGESHTLMLTIGENTANAPGRVRFFIDGEETGVLPHTFDLTPTPEQVMPFFFALQNATTTAVYWNWFEIGRIRDVERAL